MFRLTLSSSARDRLVNGLRAKGISDERVLAAIGAVDRGLFVPENFPFMAHDDVSLPIARDQRVSQPFIVATMTAALGLTDRSNVLEIGTGSGYQTTVLSHLCRWVRTMSDSPSWPPPPSNCSPVWTYATSPRGLAMAWPVGLRRRPSSLFW